MYLAWANEELSKLVADFRSIFILTGRDGRRKRILAGVSVRAAVPRQRRSGSSISPPSLQFIFEVPAASVSVVNTELAAHLEFGEVCVDFEYGRHSVSDRPFHCTVGQHAHLPAWGWDIDRRLVDLTFPEERGSRPQSSFLEVEPELFTAALDARRKTLLRILKRSTSTFNQLLKNLRELYDRMFVEEKLLRKTAMHACLHRAFSQENIVALSSASFSLHARPRLWTEVGMTIHTRTSNRFGGVLSSELVSNCEVAGVRRVRVRRERVLAACQVWTGIFVVILRDERSEWMTKRGSSHRRRRYPSLW
ncbi:hypothetical protein SCHPADRAFT_893160 [Schizopora paradoxa]|uniref:Uncharacterized protein n=1 Tax=Schizopora paradoxa TaxID=27342 RepID=A0A0H2RC06_9AGAM|nr:hypothetical protein SCHPADRAFT_893160 [Schizopora paradoxa]